jgi:hypothetical protein
VPGTEDDDEEDPFACKINLSCIVAMARCIGFLGLFLLVEGDDCELSSERGVLFSGDECVELEFERLLESLRKDTGNPRDLAACRGLLNSKVLTEFGAELLKRGDVLLEFELLLMPLSGLLISD